jgi:PST family polysaccharide transporter
MAMPASLIGQVLDDVLFPVLAQVQFDLDRVARAYRRCVAGVALITLPLSSVVVVLAPEIVHVLLGPNWNAAILPFQILAIGTLFRTSYKISDSLTRALGAVYQRLWPQWIYAGLVIGGAIIGQHWGIAGVAVAVLIAMVVKFLLMAHLSTRLAAMRWTDFVAAHAAGLKAALVVGIPAYATATTIRAATAVPGWAVLGMTLIVVLFVVAVMLLVNPAWLLGGDGRWLLQRMTGLARNRIQVLLVSRRVL